jgi:hypothetical protein
MNEDDQDEQDIEMRMQFYKLRELPRMADEAEAFMAQNLNNLLCAKLEEMRKITDAFTLYLNKYGF